MTRIARKRSAFTLLEMLVALVLMSVLAASLYASLHAAFKARDRAHSAVGAMRSATLTMELLRRDIESALPPTGILAGSFLGQDAADGSLGIDADTLEWHASLGKPAENGCDVVRLELAILPESQAGVAPDGTSGHRVLVRRVTANLLAPQLPEPVEEILCRRVRSFNLRYFGGSSWLDSWDAAANDNALPVAIEVALSIERPDRVQDAENDCELTRVFLLPCSRPATDEGTRIIRGSPW